MAAVIEHNSNRLYSLEDFPAIGVSTKPGHSKKGNGKPIEFPAELPRDVDIDALPLEAPLGWTTAAKVREVIRWGITEGDGFNGHSGPAMWFVVCNLAEAKIDPAVMASIILDSRNQIASQVLNHIDSVKYAYRQVQRAIDHVSPTWNDGEYSDDGDFWNGTEIPPRDDPQPQPKPDDDSRINVDRLDIGDDCREAIKTGVWGELTHRDEVWKVTCHLAIAGISTEEILSIMCDDRYDVSKAWKKDIEYIKKQIKCAIDRARNGKPNPNPGKGRVNIKTFADLQHQKFPVLKELVPGLIVEGCLLLAGRPKVGKSWMTLDIGLAVAMSSKCFNGRKQCVRGDVLYLALEDGDRRLQRRGSKLLPTFTGTWPANFHYATEWPRGKDGLVEIENWAKEHPAARLVVVDILAKFRIETSAKRGAYEQDYEALSGLQRLAQKYGITIIVVHHTRKMAGEDPVDEISGTQGLAGAADAFMVIKPTAQGKLLVMRGRDIEEQELVIKFIKEKCQWEILGEPETVQMSDGRAKILEILKEIGKPMSPKEITLATAISDLNAVDKMLFRMLNAGLIEKVGYGKYQLSSGGKPRSPHETGF